MLYWQQDSLLLICPRIYPQIYHRTPCPAVLICKKVKKKQRRGRIISNFTNAKEETFSSLMTTKLLLVLTVASKIKAFLSLSVWPRRQYTWTLNWKKSLLICFESYQGIPYYQHRKNRQWKCVECKNFDDVRDSLEDK